MVVEFGFVRNGAIREALDSHSIYVKNDYRLRYLEEKFGVKTGYVYQVDSVLFHFLRGGFSSSEPFVFSFGCQI